MLNKFLPAEFVKTIFQIKPKELKNRGIKAVITDLDNTLVEWDRPYATARIVEWFKEMEKHDMKVIIVSNNNEERVKAFSDPLDVPFIYKARKPLASAFKRAVKKLGVTREETVIIGDQLLTDVLGGNLAGFHTILVVPVAQSDGFFTRFNRMIERRIMSVFERKGLVNWEEKT